MDEVERLEKEIEKLRAKKNIRETWRSLIMPEPTNDEKVAAFDDMRKFALSIVDDHARTGYDNEDDEHYAYEVLMQKTLGKTIFQDVINKL